MASQAHRALPHKIRARGARAAGVVIILLGAGAAMLPAGKDIHPDMVGALLIAAGLIELVAGSLRMGARPFAMAAGGVTALAGLLFLLNPETHFFPTVVPIIGWLLLRSLILGLGSLECGGSVRAWTLLSAGMDFLLAILLIAGLSISTIIVSLFGPTPQLVATFAWVLAASFVINGLMLLEVASCAEESAAAS